MARSRRSPRLPRPVSRAGAVLTCLLAVAVGLPLTAATAYAAGITLTVVTPQPPPCEENPDLPPCDQDPPPPGPEPEPEPEPEPPGCDDGRPPPCNPDPPPPGPEPEPEPEPEPPTCDDGRPPPCNPDPEPDPEPPPCDVNPDHPRCDPCNEDPRDPRCDEDPPPRDDNTRPRVLDEFPRDGARDVSTLTDVVAVFNEDVRGVDEDTFTLFRSATGAEVPAFVFSRGDADTWVLRPDNRLRESTRYTVELQGGRFGITDRFGNDLFDFDWSFTTRGDLDRRGDFRRPRLVNEFPRDGATGVSRFTDVRAHFSERVRGVDTRSFRLFDAGDRSFVPADVFRTGSANRWVLEPARRLERFTRYVVVLRGGGNGIRDLSGNRLPTTTWSFRTSG